MAHSDQLLLWLNAPIDCAAHRLWRFRTTWGANSSFPGHDFKAGQHADIPKHAEG